MSADQSRVAEEPAGEPVTDQPDETATPATEPPAAEPEPTEPPAAGPEPITDQPPADRPPVVPPEAGESDDEPPAQSGEPRDSPATTVVDDKPTTTADEPKAAESAPAEPEAGEPEAGEPKAAEPKAAEPEAGEAEQAEPQDPFAAFAPQPERVPGRIRRAARAMGRPIVHEWSVASLCGLILAVLMTWPTLQYPRHTLPQDIWDPALQAWEMAWSGHILLTDATRLWHANAFYPEPFSFAFSDTLLGYAPAGMIGSGPASALLRYNIMYVLAHALAFIGAYALVRQLGARRTGAAVAGVAFAYAPWRLAQAGHLHVLSTGGIALALAMLARGHGWSLRYGYRPERRRTGWVLVGWLVAAWQISLGFGIGLPFAYAIVIIMVVAAVAFWIRQTWTWDERRPFGRRLVLADLLGSVIFAVTGLLLALPYFRVVSLHPEARRPVGEIRLYSVPPNGFFVAPEQSRIWGSLHAPVRAGMPVHFDEMTVLAGFTLYALALAGLFVSIWTVRQRLLLFAGVLVTAILAMGTRFFGGGFTYLPLYDYLPGWDALRTPGRLVIWTTLLLGILAAGSVTAFVERARAVRARRAPVGLGFWLRLATLLPLLLVLVEGLNRTPHPVVPTEPQAIRVAPGPVLILPSDAKIDNDIMLWSTDGFPRIVNGNSGFVPRRLAETRQLTKTFPDQASVDYLRELGVKTVIVLRDVPSGTETPSPIAAASTAPIEGLGIDRQEVDGALIFRLTN